jgi:hypothetical protein
MPTEFSFIIHATYAKDQLAADVMVTLISHRVPSFQFTGHDSLLTIGAR